MENNAALMDVMALVDVAATTMCAIMPNNVVSIQTHIMMFKETKICGNFIFKKTFPQSFCYAIALF
jgi:predicted membrane protein